MSLDFETVILRFRDLVTAEGETIEKHIAMIEDYECESRVEYKCSESGGNAAEDMTKKARQRADHRSGLNVSQAIEPVEKALNGLADRTDKCRECVSGDQNVAFLLFPRGKQFQCAVLLERMRPVSVHVSLISIKLSRFQASMIMYDLFCGWEVMLRRAEAIRDTGMGRCPGLRATTA